MPDKLWELFWCNRHLLGKLSPIAAGIIQELANKKNLKVGIFTALHTFGRDLKQNVHIHLSATCGGLNKKLKWRKMYYYHQDIKDMWRYRIIQLLREEYKNNNLTLPKKYNSPDIFKNLMQELYEIGWYVNLQLSSNNHIRNIEYLSRYFKKPPISEGRIEEYDGNNVVFRYLDHHTKTIERFSMPVFNFIARLIRHIPDKHFRTMRYYGFLSNRTRTTLLPHVYKAINQATPLDETNSLSWRQLISINFGVDPLVCVVCKIEMKLSSIYYGLSPPMMLLKSDEIIARL